MMSVRACYIVKYCTRRWKDDKKSIASLGEQNKRARPRVWGGVQVSSVWAGR